MTHRPCGIVYFSVETERQVSNQTELLDSKIISAESSSIRVPNDLMPQVCFENDFLDDRIVHESRQSLHQIPINEIEFEIDQKVKVYFARAVFQIDALSSISHWLTHPKVPLELHMILINVNRPEIISKIRYRLGNFGFMARKTIMYLTAIIKCQNFEFQFRYQLLA